MLNESIFKLKFDFDVHTTWKIKFHQSVNCFLSWVDAVSYTHLDVYKRQVKRPSEVAMIAIPSPLRTLGTSSRLE